MLFRVLLLFIGATAVEHKEVGLAADISTLEYVHTIWRHGDRTPADLLFPEDVSKWPEGIGELTARGAEQQFRLGKWLRRRYGDWLGEFDRNAIYIRSSDYNRTLMSALANMAGLFPPRKGLVEGVMWQPIPVHTKPKPTDKELYEDVACPTAEKEMDSQWNSEKAEGIRTEFATELAFFSAKLNIPKMKLKETWRIFDNLFCENQHNISWPVWINEKTLRRLRGGTLLEEIFQRFNAKASGSLGEKAKFFAYSAHDSTVAALLSTFGVFYDIYPKYATCLLIEMHTYPNETRIIRFFHKNETDSDFLIEYSIPGCDYPCTLQKLGDDLSRYFPEDWEAECGLKSNFEFIYLTLIFGLLITTVFFCTMFVLEKKRRSMKYRTLARDDNVPMLEMVDSD
ncbi:unnamed protein product [Caenorhabditis sp. 36 PRJEB53466]|nr:unnamed protein product [Caenorhabditis sp. 36 PRJEB53466]